DVLERLVGRIKAPLGIGAAVPTNGTARRPRVRKAARTR
ncbi:MAG: hypothetical protein QOJ09_1182, partial [Actinomycetota bacterium]|nr:hypothetical protein [Actinomycetota bacterium]